MNISQYEVDPRTGRKLSRRRIGTLDSDGNASPVKELICTIDALFCLILNDQDYGPILCKKTTVHLYQAPFLLGCGVVSTRTLPHGGYL